MPNPHPVRREYALLPRLAATLAAGTLFAVLIPLALIHLFPRLDAALGLPRFLPGLAGDVLGGALIVIGAVFAYWTIGDQLFIARGTPLPMMATQQLLVGGPYVYCRNPMAFGAMTAYVGIGVVVGSIASVAAVVLFGGLLLAYIRRTEEPELEARFGQAYRDYRASTPFFFPFGWRKG